MSLSETLIKEYVICLECKKRLTVIRVDHFPTKCTGAIKSKSEYLEKYPSAETMAPARRAKCAVTEEKMKLRYGEEQGAQEWLKYRQKLRDKNTFEAFQAKRGWNKEEFDAYNKSRGITLENLSRKYGPEEGLLRFQAYCEKQRTNGNTLEYFIEKLGQAEGTAKYEEVCRQKGITLENMIRVHGTDGEKRHTRWLEKTAGNFTSLKANTFFQELISQLPSTFKIHTKSIDKEFCIYDDRANLYDFVITAPCKLNIEFHGDFWHANPEKYSGDTMVRHRGGARLVSEIWEKDKKKRQLIEARGFNTYVVWESHYDAAPFATVKDALTWILSNTT